MNLVDLYPEEFKRIANQAPAIAEMAKHFDDPRIMSRALGFDNSAVQHWIKNRNKVSATSDRRAREWLLQKTPQVAPKSPDSADLLLVTCPPGAAAKAVKVLAVLGCEVVEV